MLGIVAVDLEAFGMQFSIVTPSFRNSQWLKLCVASVGDQEGVSMEHIVQDSYSDDGTLDWLPKDRRVSAYIEKDDGMYDAINRGFARAKGEFVAWLNCDEQYLPGALKAVHDFFVSHPEADVVLTDTVVVDAEGRYICHRRSVVPIKHEMWYRFPVTSCSLFLRRTVLNKYRVSFDTKWRALGDLFWVMEMVERGVSMATLRRFTSTFADTGENLCLTPRAASERQMKLEMAPAWVKLLRPAIISQHLVRRYFNGFYSQKPFGYSIYTHRSPEKRVAFQVDKPTAMWQRR